MNVLCSAKACPVILSSTCVFYEGENLVYSGINTNDNLQIALQKLDAAIGSDVFNISVVAPLQTTGGVAPILSITQSSASTDGYLSSTDWNIFNNKQDALVFGNLTEVTSSILTITGGVGSVIGSGTSIQVKQASSSQNGFLSSADWSTFNNKQNAITLTTVGSTGASTFNGTTGALNIPDYSGGFSGFVPYTGATSNVDLGEHELKAGQVEFDQSPTGTAGVGVMRWNNTDGTLDLGLKGGNVTLQIGQEEVQRVVNKSGGDLLESAYQVVKVTSAQGQRLAVDLAQGDSDANSADTIGIVTETINNNQEGFITTSGLVNEINTTGSLQGETWVDGDILYLSPTVAGKITNIKPVAPNHTVILGYVVYAHANHGKIFVKCDNGYEIGELHNCYLPSPSNNSGIFWNALTSRYENNSIAGILGYTPVSTLRTLTINGTTYDLSANRSWTVGTITSITAGTGLTGGTITTSGTIAFDTTWGDARYQLAGSYVPTNRTLTINGTTYDLSADRSWTIATGIGGSLATGQVAFGSAINTIAGSNNLFWDNTNARLGIGTNAPAYKLDVNGNQRVNGSINISNANGILVNNILNATSNGDQQTGLGINVSFLDGAFTGVNHYALQIAGSGYSQLAANVGQFNLPTNGFGLQVGWNKSNGGGETSLWYNKGGGSTGGLLIGENVSGTGTYFAKFFAATGNLLLQNGGTFTDNGHRLQIAGNIQLTNNNATLFNYLNISVLDINSNGLTFNSGVSGGYMRFLPYQGASFSLYMFSNGNVAINTLNTDTGQKFQVNGTSYFSDRIALGSNSVIASRNISNRINFAISPIAIGYELENVIPNGSTGEIRGYSTYIGQFSGASNGLLYHYFAAATSTFGGSITNQYGYFVEGGMIGATNNYGFYGNIPNGTNRWNIYMNGTASNYLAGDTGIGTTTLGTATKLTIGGSETASSAIARGGLINTTLVAAANNDVLVGLDIQPTFTNGAFTGLSNYALRANGAINVQSGAGGVWIKRTQDGIGLEINQSSYFFNALKISHGSNTNAIDITKTAYGSIIKSTNTTGTAPANFNIAGFEYTGSYSHSGGNGLGQGIILTLTNNTGTSGNLSGAIISATANSAGATAIGLDVQAASTSGTAWAIYSRTANNYMAGSLGIGGTSLSNITLRLEKNITGNTVAFNIGAFGSVLSDVTEVRYVATSINTQAASFTLGNAFHFYAEQGTIGLGSSITNQYGYFVNNTLIGATNNYGFYGNIPSGTNRWNLYMAGTANNYLAGKLLIGSFTDASQKLQVTSATADNHLLVWGASAPSIRIDNASSAATQRFVFGLATATNNFITGAVAGDICMTTQSSSPLLFGANAYEVMRITTSRNLLINTQVDSGHRIQVAGTSFMNGNTSIGVSSGTSWLTIQGGDTSKAQITLYQSTAPTSPSNGDIWFDGTDLKMRIGGVTKTFTLV